MKLNEKQKAKIVADFKAGLGKRELARRYNLSPSTIFLICKDKVPENAELVKKQVEINSALAFKSEEEVRAFKEVVEDKTSHLIYFQKSALKNQRIANQLQRIANQLLDNISDLSELEAHSRITAKNKDTVCGREPTTQINNTNAQQNNIKIEIIRKDIG